METIEDRVQSWANVAITLAGAGLLVATTVFIARHAKGVYLLNGAKTLNLVADSHRMASLAKTYDAKAAAEAMKLLVDSVTK